MSNHQRKRKPYSQKVKPKPARRPPPAIGARTMALVPLVVLTRKPGNSTFALPTACIMMAERDVANPLEYRVITTYSSPQGQLTFAIAESPEEVAEKVNAVIKGIVPPEQKPAGMIAS